MKIKNLSPFLICFLWLTNDAMCTREINSFVFVNNTYSLTLAIANVSAIPQNVQVSFTASGKYEVAIWKDHTGSKSVTCPTDTSCVNVSTPGANPPAALTIPPNNVRVFSLQTNGTGDPEGKSGVTVNIKVTEDEGALIASAFGAYGTEMIPMMVNAGRPF